jgi:thioredoxin reductase (NADPH)
VSDPILFVVDGDAVTLASLAGALKTSVPGVFAAGDVRDGSVKRLASAVGEGAIAINSVHEYLSVG